MDAETLKIFGQIGGFAGLALAVIVILTRQVLEKNTRLFSGKAGTGNFRLVVGGLLGVAVIGFVLTWWGSRTPAGQITQITDGQNSPAVAGGNGSTINVDIKSADGEKCKPGDAAEKCKTAGAPNGP
jgi:hypothetical protein